MPQRTWPDEREREYEHIKAGLEQRSDSKGMSQATAARTVDKVRAKAAKRNGRERR